MRNIIVIIIVLSVGISAMQQYDISLEKKINYNNWGTEWDSVVVIKNGIITLAVVPKIGGRVMQYDLETHPSIYIHEENKGKPITDGSALIGGFRQLPSPQSDFDWPPPPKVDFGQYTCTVLQDNADSAVVSLLSPIEDSDLAKYKTHKGLQFRRVITMYKASSHVKVVMTMYNKSQQTMTHGIWDITQSTCTNNNKADLTNFWVYFQRNPSSKLNNGKGYVQYNNAGTGGSSQWKPDAAPGNIMGVQFKKLQGKIGADCTAGWICFNDQLDAYAYVKTFTYRSGETYPDSGASVQVYTYANNTLLEVEVLGPLTSLAAGDSTSLVEHWYATRSSGPVLAVNDAGLVTSKLVGEQSGVDQKGDSLNVKGVFGIFYQGTVTMQFCNADGKVVATSDSLQVTPTDSLVVNKKLKLPPEGVMLQLVAFDSKGAQVGILDSTLVPNPLPKAATDFGNVPLLAFDSFNAVLENNSIAINVPFEGIYCITLYTVNGKQIDTRTVKAPDRFSVKLDDIAGNAIVVLKISGNGKNISKRLVITQ